jgi:hypothetical protein
MQEIKRSPVTRFFVVPLTLVALFSGCTWTKTVETRLPVEPTYRSETAEIVAVTTSDETYIEFDAPATFANDTIRALVALKPEAWATADLDRIWIKGTARRFNPASVVVPVVLVALLVTSFLTTRWGP